MFLERTARDLEEAGHNITFLHTPLTLAARDHPSHLIRGPLSVFPLIASEAEDVVQRVLDRMLWAKHMSLLETYTSLVSLAYLFSRQCSLIFDSRFQSILHQNEYDLILSDPTFSPCLLRLTRDLSAPNLETVGISFLVTQAFAHGGSFPFSYVSGNVLPFGRESLTFSQRILNTLDLTSNILIEYVFFKWAGGGVDGTPPSYFYNRVKNISGYFINDHEFLQPPRPRLRTTHLIGGPQPGPLPPIPRDLLDFMRGNHSGVIVMSLSTISRSVHMPPDFMDAFIKTFTRLPHYRIIWRYEGEIPAVKNASHIRVLPWLPLKSILAHPATVAMITHGGINSVMEAMYFGIPILGVPLYGDQDSVLAKAGSWGGLLRLPKSALSSTTLPPALNKLLNDPRPTLAMRRVSRLMQDRLLSPREEGLFWSGHVLRHGGGEALYRTKSTRLSSFQYFGGDVIAPALLLAALLAFTSI